MKILRKDLRKAGGFISVVPEDVEDIWFLYSLVRKGDLVKASTQRKIKQEGKESRRRWLLMELETDETVADLHQGLLMVKGRIQSEHEDVKTGSFHTLHIGLAERVTIHKTHWDRIDIDTAHRLSDVTKKDSVCVALTTETTASVFLVTTARIETCARAKVKNKKDLKTELAAVLGVHGKGSSLVVVGTQSKKSIGPLEEALEPVLKKTKRHYVWDVQPNTSVRSIMERRDVLEKIKETRLAEEGLVFAEAMRLIEEAPEMVSCGIEGVEGECRRGNIKKILFLDAIFTGEDRKRCIPIVDFVRKKGRQMCVISSFGYIGDTLKKLGSVCCIKERPGGWDGC
ncbi:MAG: pelota protein [Amphiamblys sp. WSBS2006]|nr:MAG: pelota protein [Amphiamblys sp. WSBS2006]